MTFLFDFSRNFLSHNLMRILLYFSIRFLPRIFVLLFDAILAIEFNTIFSLDSELKFTANLQLYFRYIMFFDFEL